MIIITLQRVQRAVLCFEIVDVWFDGQRGTAGAFNDLRRGELASVAVNIFTQPAVQGAEFTLRDFIRNFRMCLERRVVELRRKNITQCISLERAADHASVPVNILQDAITVVGRDNSKIMLEALLAAMV